MIDETKSTDVETAKLSKKQPKAKKTKAVELPERYGKSPLIGEVEAQKEENAIKLEELNNLGNPKTFKSPPSIVGKINELNDAIDNMAEKLDKIEDGISNLEECISTMAHYAGSSAVLKGFNLPPFVLDANKTRKNRG